MGQALYKGPHPFGIPHIKNSLFRSVGGFDVKQLVADPVKCLVPGNGFELAGTPFSSPQQRGSNPVLMVNPLTAGRTLGTKRTATVCIFPGSLNFNNHTLFHIGINSAMGMRAANGADRLANFDAAFFRRHFTLGQSINRCRLYGIHFFTIRNLN